MTTNYDSKPLAHIKFQLKTFEKIPVRIWDHDVEASQLIARSIALAIRQRQQDGQ